MLEFKLAENADSIILQKFVYFVERVTVFELKDFLAIKEKLNKRKNEGLFA
jgi:hypothetical protein